MRCTLCNRLRQIHLRAASLAADNVAARTTPYQRPVEGRPPFSIRKSWLVCLSPDPAVRRAILLTPQTHCLTDFNLDFYTEVQDLKYLETSLNTGSSRYASLNMAICQLIEDFSLVGFETLAVEVCYTHCTRTRIDELCLVLVGSRVHASSNACS